MNLFVAALPIAATLAALRRKGVPLGFGKVFEDGFLYFFAFLLAIGLITDATRDSISSQPILGHGAVLAVVLGGCIFCALSWSAYCNALVSKIEGIPQPIWSPVTLTVIALSSNLILRYRVNMWGA